MGAQKRIDVDNKLPQELSKEIRGLKDGTYVVEDLKNGSKITITKPGLLGQNDIIVEVKSPTGLGGGGPPAHTEIFKAYEYGEGEFRNDLRKIGKGLVVGGKRSLEEDRILKCAKWIFVQEDVNHPPPRMMGRRYPISGFDLIDEGFTAKEVNEVLNQNSENMELKDRAKNILEKKGYKTSEISKLIRKPKNFKTRGNRRFY